MRAAFASFVDHLLCLGVCFGQNFRIARLRFGQLFFDFLRIELAFLDRAPALLQHSKNWLVGEALQQERYDTKANHL